MMIFDVAQAKQTAEKILPLLFDADGAYQLMLSEIASCGANSVENALLLMTQGEPTFLLPISEWLGKGVGIDKAANPVTLIGTETMKRFYDIRNTALVFYEGCPSIDDDKRQELDFSEKSFDLSDIQDPIQQHLIEESVRSVLHRRFSMQNMDEEDSYKFIGDLRDINEEFKRDFNLKHPQGEYKPAEKWFPLLQKIIDISGAEIKKHTEFAHNVFAFIDNFDKMPLSCPTMTTEKVKECLVTTAPTYKIKTFRDGNIDLVLFKSDFENIVVPDYINGSKVTRLSTGCLQCPNMTRLEIPDSVVSIQPDFVYDLAGMLESDEVEIKASDEIMRKIVRASKIKIDRPKTVEPVNVNTIPTRTELKNPSASTKSTETVPQVNTRTEQESDLPKKADFKKDKTKALYDDVNGAIASLVLDNNFPKWLQIVSRFPRLAFNNQILVYLQAPESTTLASFNAWHKRERKITKGQHGITLFKPEIKERMVQDFDSEGKKKYNFDGKPIMRTVKSVSYKTHVVFDVSQTEGKEVITPKREYVPEKLMLALGVTPSEDTAKYNHTIRRTLFIKVDKLFEKNPPKIKLTASETKTIKDAAHFALLVHFEMEKSTFDVSPRLKSSIGAWSSLKVDDIKARLQAIQSAASKIIDEAETKYLNIKDLDKDKLLESAREIPEEYNLRHLRDLPTLASRIEEATKIADRKNKSKSGEPQAEENRVFKNPEKGGNSNAFL